MSSGLDLIFFVAFPLYHQESILYPTSLYGTFEQSAEQPRGTWRIQQRKYLTKKQWFSLNRNSNNKCRISISVLDRPWRRSKQMISCMAEDTKIPRNYLIIKHNM